MIVLFYPSSSLYRHWMELHSTFGLLRPLSIKPDNISWKQALQKLSKNVNNSRLGLNGGRIELSVKFKPVKTWHIKPAHKLKKKKKHRAKSKRIKSTNHRPRQGASQNYYTRTSKRILTMFSNEGPITNSYYYLALVGVGISVLYLLFLLDYYDQIVVLHREITSFIQLHFSKCVGLAVAVLLYRLNSN